MGVVSDHQVKPCEGVPCEVRGVKQARVRVVRLAGPFAEEVPEHGVGVAANAVRHIDPSVVGVFHRSECAYMADGVERACKPGQHKSDAGFARVEFGAGGVRVTGERVALAHTPASCGSGCLP